MFEQRRWPREAWFPIAAGLLCLWSGARAEPIVFLLAAPPGLLLLAGGGSTLLWPGDHRIPHFTALGGVLGVLFALLAWPWLGLWLGALLLAGSAAAFVAAGASSVHQEPHVEQVPLPEPSLRLFARVALDEAVMASLQAWMRFPGGDEARRVHDEVVEASEIFAANGWLEKPRDYHAQPPELHSPRLVTRNARRIEYEHLSFESEYEPHAREPGRERWLAYAPNRTAHAWVLRHAGAERPWLVCVHGFRMGSPRIDFTAFNPRKFHEGLGLNLLFPVLPLHGPRKVGLRSGDRFMDGNVLDTIHGEAQALWDLRRMLSWMEANEKAIWAADGGSELNLNTGGSMMMMKMMGPSTGNLMVFAVAGIADHMVPGVRDPALGTGTVLPGSTYELTRTAGGLSITVEASGLPPGTYTNWWIIDEGGLSNGRTRAFEIGLRATGGIVGPDGIGKFSATLDAGPLPDADFVTNLRNGDGNFDTPLTASVMYILRYHGPEVPGLVDAQIGEVLGGCVQPQPDGGSAYTPGDYVCYDPQRLIDKGSAAGSVDTAFAGVAKHLVDDKGMSLYIFTKDTPGSSPKSACTSAGCMGTWPLLRSNGGMMAGKGVDKEKLGNYKHPSGMMQATYNGWPLYYYAPDKAAGDIKGQGFAGAWWIIDTGGDGITGEAMVGEGAAGPAGPGGGPGPAGPRGADGDAGAAGAAGARGPAGSAGSAGAAGPAGPAGSAGSDGAAGSAGSAGAAGAAGAAGGGALSVIALIIAIIAAIGAGGAFVMGRRS